jgi:uncharacterized sulfatase
MAKKISRVKLIIISVAAALVLSLAGLLLWRLTSTRSTEALYGPYPDGAEKEKCPVVNPAARRPNVLIVYCDDLGYGDLGCYGSRAIDTPNVDRLADEGVRFTDFHACSAICAPSRAGLLTGRYPFRTGIIGNTYPKDEPLSRVMARNFGQMLGSLGVLDIRERYIARGISDAEITLAEALKSGGYRTCMVGKWHLGDYSSNRQYNPLNHGFDHYLGVPYSNDMVPFPLYRNETELSPDLGQDRDQARLTGLYTREAVQFIQEDGEEPFFIYLAHTFPHQPIFASEEFRGTSQAGRFGDAVEEIDWSLGRIREVLEQEGELDETLIIFTSDNGPWYEGSSSKLRGRKGQSYEGGFRVPFIARWPGVIPAGSEVDALSSNLDLFPTLLALAGVGLPEDRIIDGRNILPLLSGRSSASPYEAFYYYHYDRLDGLRTQRWKYFKKTDRYTWPIAIDTAPIPNALGKKQMGERWPLLYDMELDPAESYNTIDTYPHKAEELREQYEKWKRRTEENPRGFR